MKIKKLSVMIVAALVSLTSLTSIFGQAPLDVSPFTNHVSAAFWALKQVNEWEVTLTVTSAGTPYVPTPPCPPGYVCTSPSSLPSSVTKTMAYSGPPSFRSISKAMNGTVLAVKAPIPDSQSIIQVTLRGDLPDAFKVIGNKQELLNGSISGKAVYDGSSWRLPNELAKAGMFLAPTIFISVPGIVKAWVVETNSSGWAYKKSLDVWQGLGVNFDTSLCGEVVLCMEVANPLSENGGVTDTWQYDLRGGIGNGLRMPIVPVIAIASVTGAEGEYKEFPDNAADLSYWMWTYKPDNSAVTYGAVPGFIVRYTQETGVMISLGSAVGYANKFAVTRIPDIKGGLEIKYTLEVPIGMSYYGHTFTPGLYHINPLGINVSRDWWRINEVDGWNYNGGGGIGKGVAIPSTSTTEVMPVPVTP